MLCDPGKFMNATGASACLSCPPGTFTDQSGATYCKKCPFGVLINASGSTNSSICDKGKYIVRLVMPAMNWTASDVRRVTNLIAIALGISPLRISIEDRSGRRRLLASTTTIDVWCDSEEDASQVQNTLTVIFLANLLQETGVPYPGSTVSHYIINLGADTSTQLLPTSTSTTVTTKVSQNSATSTTVTTKVSQTTSYMTMITAPQEQMVATPPPSQAQSIPTPAPIQAQGGAPFVTYGSQAGAGTLAAGAVSVLSTVNVNVGDSATMLGLVGGSIGMMFLFILIAIVTIAWLLTKTQKAKQEGPSMANHFIVDSHGGLAHRIRVRINRDV